ncbi:Crp/Fnr family transcriptional regulator [Pedobacter nutrimenti]|jgi:CRP-like cAMP-binding protein|uniref:CRP-like cAMP-binding protein n=1 Tax=Pedobacter nutrimenti TaxID=1241337 RepID=A0A318UGW5_9SPHI|nr:Crp/Fnr family transcriptional regulator [Pedobacter nutrimenti]PYF74740.1 CRP-like cAMP-binding protein [Pedobacter nutrimenti]
MKYDASPWYQRMMKKYPIVTEQEWKLLDSMTKVKVIKKGDSFLQFGKVARYAAFVLSGQFKFSILDEEGKEKILKFGFADDFLANCESYYNNAPSNVSIIALEDAVIRRINIKQLQPLYDLYLNLSRVNLQIYQEALEQQSEHEYILSMKSPVRRYRFLLDRRPAIIQKISLTNIARYLYVSREAVSRARLYLFNQSGKLSD